MLAAPGRGGVRGHRTVGENQVQPVYAQLLKQLLQACGANDQLHLGLSDHRPQEVFLEVARQGGDRADAQTLQALQFPAFGEGQQLAAETENALGIFQYQMPHLGQSQGAAIATEQFMAQLLLQLANLRGQGRLRHV